MLLDTNALFYTVLLIAYFIINIVLIRLLRVLQIPIRILLALVAILLFSFSVPQMTDDFLLWLNTGLFILILVINFFSEMK